MRKLEYLAAVALFGAALAFGGSAFAALQTGAQAPDFTTQASLAGKEFKFSLADALKKGPVVLYFYPGAFTKGCTIEANEFADATEKFAALGATVIGVSFDNIETLKKFYKTECRDKFAVAADTDQSIMKAYDAVLTERPDRASRTSYVITPNGKIIYALTERDPIMHVTNTLAAVKEWDAKKAAK